MSNWRTRVLLNSGGRLEIRPSKADLPVFENLWMTSTCAVIAAASASFWR